VIVLIKNLLVVITSLVTYILSMCSRVMYVSKVKRQDQMTGSGCSRTSSRTRTRTRKKANPSTGSRSV